MARIGANPPDPVPYEVAIRTGWLQNGQEIPLPEFADRTAGEDECYWIVSPKEQHLDTTVPADWGLHCQVNEANRTVACWTSKNGSWHMDGNANYMIIAIRPVKKVPIERVSWGEVKGTFER